MLKIAIIGAGPAGIYTAIKILETGLKADITIFDPKDPLITILPTGNRRCNLSYLEYDNKELAKFYPRGEKFLYSIFSRYGVQETLDDFKKYGIETYVQDDNRIFPTSNSSKEVRNKLLNAIKNKATFVKRRIDTPLANFDCTVLATGLKAGAKLAELYGHNVIPLKPSLTGLKIKEKEFLTLKGVSFNNFIFTEWGVSGPYIYKISSINAYKEFPYEIKIPLFDENELNVKLKENPKKLFKNVLSDFIPKSLSEILVKNEKQCANISKKEIEAVKTLKLTIIGTDNKGEIVHAGGVDLNEVDKNLKSKIAKNLWIVGEALDIDGFTGGFNLQNCWSSAALAAYDIFEKFSS